MEQNTYANTSDRSLNKFFAQTYFKMGIGLIVSFLTGFVLLKTMPMQALSVVSNPVMMIVAGIIQIVIVLSMSGKAYQGKAGSTMALFLLYSLVSGITFVTIFAIYNASLIVNALLVTALTFIGMSVYGSVTKRNLSAWSNFLVGSLIGILVITLLNFIFKSSALALLVDGASVLIFAGYMAWDTQMMRNAYYSVDTNDSSTLAGLSTFWALQLYMDIIGMFINLLQILSAFSDND